MQPGSTEVKNGKQLLLYFVAAIKLSLSLISAADMLSAKLNLPWLLADTDPRRSCSKRMNVSSI